MTENAMMRFLFALATLAYPSTAAPAQEEETPPSTGLSRTVTLGEGQTSEIRVRVSRPAKTVLTAVISTRS